MDVVLMDSPNQKQRKKGIDSFPDELLLKIFSYLSQDDLDILPSVSPRWERLSRDPVLQTRAFIDLNKMGLEKALVQVKMMKRLRNVTVASWSRLDCDKVLAEMSNLDTLKMVGVTIKNEKSLIGLVRRSGQLRVVHIQLSQISIRCLRRRVIRPRHLLDVFAPCPYLESLYLDNADFISKPINLHLTRQWGRLKSVTLGYDESSSGDELLFLLQFTAQIRHLRHISGYFLAHENVINIRYFQGLQSLELHCTLITDMELLEGVAMLVNLRHLNAHFYHNKLTLDAIKAFFSKPHIFLQLETLKLAGFSQLDDSCLEVISRCVSLKQVMLTGCHNITISGLNILKRNVVKVQAIRCGKVDLEERKRKLLLHFAVFAATKLLMIYLSTHH